MTLFRHLVDQKLRFVFQTFSRPGQGSAAAQISSPAAHKSSPTRSTAARAPRLPASNRTAYSSIGTDCNRFEANFFQSSQTSRHAIFQGTIGSRTSSGFLGAFPIHLKTVRSEMSKPSIFNSPCIRGAPDLGFSPTMRKISSRNSLLTRFRPARVLCRESHVQYNLKPVRCQPTTVSGWTMTSVRFPPDQNRRSITQKNLSGVVSLGWSAVSSRRRAVVAKPKPPAANPGGNTDCKPSGP
jgi:hypothetical protein